MPYEDKWKKYGTYRPAGFDRTTYKGNHVTPLPYSRRGGAVNYPVRLPNGGYGNFVDLPNTRFANLTMADAGTARNKAWSDLIDQVRDGPASLGQAIGESREAMTMVAERFGSVYRSYKALRKGDFRGALRSLDVNAKRRHRNKLRAATNEVSSLWLEYSFGWSPMLQDIYDGCTVLTKAVPSGRFVGRGKQYYEYDNKYKWPHEVLTGKMVVRQGADVFVDNPNKFLLASAGLANPVEVAWNLVPFSFLADWAFGVSSFLGGYTDLMGCSVQNAYRTFSFKGYVSCKYQWSSSPVVWCPVQQGPVYRVIRELGLSKPKPNFNVFANIGQSVKRAANAASLLGVILTGK